MSQTLYSTAAKVVALSFLPSPELQWKEFEYCNISEEIHPLKGNYFAVSNATSRGPGECICETVFGDGIRSSYKDLWR